MTIGIVTTFSDKGYEEYAHLLISSIQKFVDEKIEIFLYVDNVKINPTSTNIRLIRFESTVPDLVNFKNRNKDRPVDNFMYDAVRFKS